MSLIKWSPFAFDPFEGMEKYFENLPQQSIIPPVDMYQTDKAVVVETPLAGVDPNKVDISIENGILSIKGSSERKTEVDEKDYYRKEIRSGSIFRQIALPAAVQEGKAEASFDNGILKVMVPKASGEKAKVVKINVKKK